MNKIQELWDEPVEHVKYAAQSLFSREMSEALGKLPKSHPLIKRLNKIWVQSGK